MTFDVGYYGAGARDTSLARGFDALDVRADIRSDGSAGRKFHYDASLRYRFGEDKAGLSGLSSGHGWLREHLFGLGLSMGPSLTPYSRALLGVSFNMADYGPGFNSYAGDISVTPRYLLDKGRWDLDLGVKLAFHFFNRASSVRNLFDIASTQFVYPDVSISFEAVRDYLDLYFKAGGGDEVMTWSDLLGHNRHFDIYRTASLPLGNIVERVSADIGLRGNIASRFGYDLHAGYSNYANAFLDGVMLSGADMPVYLPVFGACQLFRLTLDYEWTSQDFSLDGSLSWKNSDAAKKNNVAKTYISNACVNKTIHVGGYGYRFEGDDYTPREQVFKKNHVTFYSNGKMVYECDGYKDAASYCGLCESYFQDIAQGKRYSPKLDKYKIKIKSWKDESERFIN